MEALSLAVRHIFESAQCLRESHTIEGIFPPYEAECKTEYDRLINLALSLNESLPSELKQIPEEFLGVEGDSAPMSLKP